MRTPRTKFAAVTVNVGTKILLMGGKKLLVLSQWSNKIQDGKRTSTIEQYNILDNKWQTLPIILQKARWGFAAASTIEGRVMCSLVEEIYICGGNDGSILNSLEVLYLSKGTWKNLQPMKFRR